MWRTKRIAFTVVAACAALATASDARALCTAQEVINAASGCPASSAPCTINTAITANDGCTLDFGSRQVTLAAHLTIGAGMVTIKAGSFTINSSGLIDGKVNGGSGRGGSITIETTGDFTLQGGGQRNSRRRYRPGGRHPHRRRRQREPQQRPLRRGLEQQSERRRGHDHDPRRR